MAIETLDDIFEKLADRLGIYGAHDEDDTEGEREDGCRMCFVSELRGRVLAAVEVEQKLYPVKKGE